MSIFGDISSQSFIVHALAGISIFIYIIFFIFSAIGISTIAKRRGLEKKAPLAFIPLLQYSVVGAIADDIIGDKNKLNKHKKKKIKFAIIYPLLSLLNPFNMVNSGLGFAVHFYLQEQFNPWYLAVAESSKPHIYSMGLGVVEILLLLIFITVTKEIFDEYDGENTNLFVALSVLLKLHPILFFKIRNNTVREYEYSKFDDEYYENFNDFKQVGD